MVARRSVPRTWSCASGGGAGDTCDMGGLHGGVVDGKRGKRGKERWGVDVVEGGRWEREEGVQKEKGKLRHMKKRPRYGC